MWTFLDIRVSDVPLFSSESRTLNFWLGQISSSSFHIFWQNVNSDEPVDIVYAHLVVCCLASAYPYVFRYM